MAVSAPTWLSDALRWRWTPTIALILGSLLYVLCAMLLVPSDISFSGTAASAGPRSATGSGSLSTDDVEGMSEADSADDPAAVRRQKRLRRRAATAEAPAGESPPAEPAPAPVE